MLSSISSSSLLISIGNSFCVVNLRGSFAFARYISVNMLFIWLLCTGKSCRIHAIWIFGYKKITSLYYSQLNILYLHYFQIRIFLLFCWWIAIETVAVQNCFICYRKNVNILCEPIRLKCIKHRSYLDQLKIEMADAFGVRIRGIFLVNGAPSHLHPHRFDEHFLLNTKIENNWFNHNIPIKYLAILLLLVYGFLVRYNCPNIFA